MPSYVSVSTRYKSNNLPKLRKAIENFQELSVSVGVHNDAGSYPVTQDEPNPPLITTVALAQEFGTDHNPARPFFYPTFASKEQQIKAKIAKAAALVVERFADPVKALSTIGFAVQVWVQNQLKSNVGPALGWSPGSKRYLAQRLIKYPESGSRTLIASGLLLRSIRFKVWRSESEQILEGPAVGDVSAPSGRPAQHGGGGGDAVPGAKEGRAVARRSAADFKKGQREARGAAKEHPDEFRSRFMAQRGARGLPPRKGG